MVTGACYIAWIVRRIVVEKAIPSPTTPQGWESWVREPLAVPLVPLALLSLWFFGMYRPRRDQALWQEQGAIIRAIVGSVVGLVAVIWLVGGQEIFRAGGGLVRLGVGLGGASMSVEAGRVQLLALIIACVVLVGGERLAFRLTLRAMRRRGWNLRHVAIIGTGRLARICCRTLDRNSWTGIHVAYFISHNETNRGPSELLGRPVYGGIMDLERTLETHRPDAVYLALPSMRTSVRPQLLRRLERFCVSVRLVPDVHPRYTPQSMSLNELDGMPIMSVREDPLTGVGGIAKRLLDMLGGTVALIIFSPIMAVVALLVRFTSPGPVVFRQKRVSLGGEEFEIFKFRTMFNAGDESGPARWTSRDDSRVTPIGKWLRVTSLDELPQLFNVLRGDMSLVGPRPERPELIVRFREDWRGYMLRQHVKSGMTGWAQVNGLRGDTSLKKRLQHDLFYVRNWSLGFDIKILWLTVFRGFMNPNAH